ncbi:MAG TPA: Holliday junction resolvase RuvX [Candidatus Nanoperiomorbaceae bacterium]|nr:Holliday junction resolvase RuvX [Candidatus Nanoperiomorbaceae bacterium]HMQ96694.1 Holliday junction resolvase RuvX [Candidatus Nanoperiomorbaceae bacterium]HMR86051.1 Holliday junction resolvase RuvX [Candidatus Nanoperiomorbaceae bacterium]HMU11793.1 Holliday junction resolvase RuvX [Candidatus Nanoperiomorbaceae bacterium]
MNRAQGVVIGLDIGTRRIGVARGDLAVGIATPLAAIGNDNETFEQLKKIISQENTQTIVVGLPRNSRGEETAQSEISRRFADRLKHTVTAEVVLQDESVTSVEAERRLRGRKDFRESMLRDGTLDSEAATLILTDYLEEASHGTY